MNPPKKVTFLIALILGVLGVVAQLGIIKVAFLATYAFWFVVAGLVLLLLGCCVKGL